MIFDEGVSKRATEVVARGRLTVAEHVLACACIQSREDLQAGQLQVNTCVETFERFEIMSSKLWLAVWKAAQAVAKGKPPAAA